MKSVVGLRLTAAALGLMSDVFFTVLYYQLSIASLKLLFHIFSSSSVITSDF
jgi:hypothetical protein